MKVCLAPTRVLCCPTLGGHAWVYINWTLGLRANGCEVMWLERLHQGVSPDEALSLIRHLRARLEGIGVDVPLALVMTDDERRRFQPVEEELSKLTVDFDEVASESDLLLNFYYPSEPEILESFRRTTLIDIDPGLLQHWIYEGQLKVAEHDAYFSIGETVGTAEAKFPDCGLRWQYTAPAVYLPAWPEVTADTNAPYTTVSTWWSKWEVFDGEAFSNEKRTSFLKFLDLPARTPVSLELALFMSDTEKERRDRQTLVEKGWRLQDPEQVSGTPNDYRRYIQQSRGEFSCAKPSCLRLSNAWVSDRTLCYLASGKPAIVQHTGLSRFLPDASGLFRFRNPDEAIQSLKRVEADYDRHARNARALAEEFFDAEKVVASILERTVP